MLDIPKIRKNTKTGPDALDLQLLRCLAKGMTRAQAAAEARISVNTCRWRVRRLYDIFEVTTATQLVLEADRQGLLTP